MTTSQFSSSPGSSQFGDDSSSTSDTGSTKDQAQEKAHQVAGTAADQGRHLASTARDEAANVAGEAQTQVRNLMSEATSELHEQTRSQQQRLAGTVRSFGEDLQGMAEQQSGMASDVARQVADRAQTLASHLEGREPGDLLGEVRDFARRRPGTFLLGALAAGVVAGRLTRATKAATSESGSGPLTDQGPTGGTAGFSGAPATSTSTLQAQPPPLAADVTSPADPLSQGADAPSSGPGLGTSGDLGGTSTGDPLAGARADDADTTPEAAPWSDPGNRS